MIRRDMGLRLAGLIVVVAVLAAGAFIGWPFLQGYLGQQPPPPVRTEDKPPSPAPSTPAGQGAQQGAQQTEQHPSPKSGAPPPESGVSASGASSGESQIDIDYLAKLAAIGNYYQGQLNALVAQAYSSYQAVKAGKSNASLLTLAGQYIEKGQALESQSDQQFNGVLDQYRAALEKAGEPLTYEERAKAEYAAAKAAERQRILSAAEQYLK